MAGSTAKASSTTTKGVAVKRPPSSSSNPTSPTGSKKARTSLTPSAGYTTITPTSSSPSSQAIKSNLRPNTNTAPETPLTRSKPNETAILINAYSEISDSFSSLMERLKEVNHARTAQSSLSLSTQNIMFLASVESSMMDTMKQRLNDVATRFEAPKLKR